MHKIKIVTLAVLALIAATTPARADINALINFDDLPGTIGDVPQGYQGLSWGNFFYLQPNGSFLPSDLLTADPFAVGFVNGVVSQPTVAYNKDGQPAAFFDIGNPFVLTSAYFTSTAYWTNPGSSFLEVKGTNTAISGDPIFDVILELNDHTPTLATFGWTVDLVEFDPLNPNPNDPNGGGFDFVMDDLQLGNPVGQVPEPGALFLLGTAATTLLPRLRRRLNRR